MAIKAISTIKPDWYTPQCEEGEDEPTRFKLKPLDGTQYLDVMSEVTTSLDGDIQVTGRGLKLAAKWGVVGWENFSDPETGKEIKYSAVNVPRVPPVILSELVGVILERSELGEDQTKNS